MYSSNDLVRGRKNMSSISIPQERMRNIDMKFFLPIFKLIIDNQRIINFEGTGDLQ